MNFYNQQQNPYMQRTNGIKWVQGVEGAKAYQMIPNSNDVLLDSENDGIFYIKICDGVGMCTLRTFKYEEITNQPAQSVDLSEYVKKTELETLINSMLGGSANEQSVQSAKPNKVRQMISMFKGLNNPQAMAQQLVSRNPQLKAILDASNGNYEKAFRDYAKQMGVNPDEIINLLK